MHYLSERSVSLLVSLGFAMAAMPSHAAEATSNLTLTATVQSSCSISDATLAFGVLNVSAAVTPFDASASVDVVCTSGQSAVISAGDGLQYDSGSASRRLALGSNYMRYALHQNAGRTTPLTTASTMAYTGTGAITPITIYGRIESAEVRAAAPGTYSDTVQLKITY